MGILRIEQMRNYPQCCSESVFMSQGEEKKCKTNEVKVKPCGPKFEWEV